MKFIYKILSLFVLRVRKYMIIGGVRANHKQDVEMIKKAEKLVRITPNPNFNYSYDIMRIGVIQLG